MAKDGKPRIGTQVARSARREPWIPPRRPTGFVYFIRTPDCQFVKIGWSDKSPDSRFDSLQTGNHLKLERVGLLRCDQLMEAMLHERFKRYRLHNEWFRLSPPLAAFIRQHATPWEALPQEERRAGLAKITPDEGLYPRTYPGEKRAPKRKKAGHPQWRPQDHHKSHIARMAKIYEAAGVEYVPPKYGHKQEQA